MRFQDLPVSPAEHLTVSERLLESFFLAGPVTQYADVELTAYRGSVAMPSAPDARLFQIVTQQFILRRLTPFA
jgi:hypothetical protein